MSCRFDTGSLRLSSFRIPKFAFAEGTRTRSNRYKPINLRAHKVSSALSLDAKSASDFGEDSAETKRNGPRRQPFPNSSEVESLVTEICDSTSIAEFELKVDGFQLYVARGLSGRSGNPPAPPNPVTANMAAVIESNSNGSVMTPSLAITKPVSSSGDIQPYLDKASDESLVILRSPTVGFFRRSRTIKGKRVPPSCKEKQIVKEGQVLCYIEQLGGELPVESEVSGEVVKIISQDGDPVGYNDDLIAIIPSSRG